MTFETNILPFTNRLVSVVGEHGVPSVVRQLLYLQCTWGVGADQLTYNTHVSVLSVIYSKQNY